MINKFIAAMLLCSVLAFMPGCASQGTPQAIIVKSENSLTIAVDDAMQAWHDYVVNPVNGASRGSVQTVHDAYDKYHATQLIAKAALEKWIAAGSPAGDPSVALANKAVADAASALLSLITQLTTTHSH